MTLAFPAPVANQQHGFLSSWNRLSGCHQGQKGHHVYAKHLSRFSNFCFVSSSWWDTCLEFGSNVWCRVAPVLPEANKRCCGSCSFHKVFPSKSHAKMLEIMSGDLLCPVQMFGVCACVCQCVSLVLTNLQTDKQTNNQTNKQTNKRM